MEVTRAWLRAKLDGDERFDRTRIADQLRALEAGEGPDYFQIVMEIFAAHPRITLVRA